MAPFLAPDRTVQGHANEPLNPAAAASRSRRRAGTRAGCRVQERRWVAYSLNHLMDRADHQVGFILEDGVPALRLCRAAGSELIPGVQVAHARDHLPDCLDDQLGLILV